MTEIPLAGYVEMSMMPSPRVLIAGTAVIAAAAGAACELEHLTAGSLGFTPGQGAGRLVLTSSVGRDEIAVGDTTTIVFRLRNIGGAEVTLEFSSGCQVMPFVTERTSGRIVVPQGGAWACITALTQLTVPAGKERIYSLPIQGGTTVPPGDYVAFARVESAELTLQSPDLIIRVR